MGKVWRRHQELVNNSFPRCPKTEAAHNSTRSHLNSPKRLGGKFSLTFGSFRLSKRRICMKNCFVLKNKTLHLVKRAEWETKLFQLSRFRINCLTNNKFMSLFFWWLFVWFLCDFLGSWRWRREAAEWLFMADWNTFSLNVDANKGR